MIYKCRECGYTHDKIETYCPTCGCKEITENHFGTYSRANAITRSETYAWWKPFKKD